MALQASSKGGLGVFLLNKRVASGTCLGEYRGEIITAEQAKTHEKNNNNYLFEVQQRFVHSVALAVPIFACLDCSFFDDCF